MERTLPNLPPDDEESFLAEVLPVVTAWCMRLAAPGVDAEAAAHDVLLVLLRRRADLRPGAPVLPWAWGITRHVVRAHRRTAWLRRWFAGREPEAPATSDPHRDYAAAEQARLVHAVLQALGEKHREVLVLCDVEERPRAEVATLLGLPTGTVKSRLRLAREAFRAEAARRGITIVLLLEEPFDG
jgi:RNA polymerase sigma-70 factor (ECF subfamily)